MTLLAPVTGRHYSGKDLLTFLSLVRDGAEAGVKILQTRAWSVLHDTEQPSPRSASLRREYLYYEEVLFLTFSQLFFYCHKIYRVNLF